MSVLSNSFFRNIDVLQVSRDLIGKVIYTRKENKITAGIITETEAYEGITDKASHAYMGRRTQRNEVMYVKGGAVYVYLCYGIHYMLNFVTNDIDIPHAVLVRSIQPIIGIEEMEKRRNLYSSDKNFSNGPGKLTRCLGIDLKLNGALLPDKDIWVEDNGLTPTPEHLEVTPRIGIDYAEEHASLPYRFHYIANFQWDS